MKLLSTALILISLTLAGCGVLTPEIIAQLIGGQAITTDIKALAVNRDRLEARATPLMINPAGFAGPRALAPPGQAPTVLTDPRPPR